MDNCVFCKIVAKQLPAEIISETDEAMVIKDLNPKASIHYLIIPKHHYKDISEVDDCCVASRMLQMARYVAAKSNIKDYRLLINNGSFQHVPHLHMHFLAGTGLSEF